MSETTTDRGARLRELALEFKNKFLENLDKGSRDNDARLDELRSQIEMLGYSIVIVATKDKSGKITRVQLAFYTDGSDPAVLN